MQNYSNPSAQRNTFRAADAGPVGGNQSQGKGEIPGKVSVPFPEKANKPQGGSGGVKSNPPGFNQGIIPGKV